MIIMWWSCKTLFWFVLFLQNILKSDFIFIASQVKARLLLTVILYLIFWYVIKYMLGLFFWDLIVFSYLVCFSIIESGWFTQILGLFNNIFE